ALPPFPHSASASFFSASGFSLIHSLDMSGQSNIRGRGRGRPRKTREEQTLSQQRRLADKNARDSFHNKQARVQRRRRLQKRHAIQRPEEEGEVINREIAPLTSTSGRIPLVLPGRGGGGRESDVGILTGRDVIGRR